MRRLFPADIPTPFTCLWLGAVPCMAGAGLDNLCDKSTRLDSKSHGMWINWPKRGVWGGGGGGGVLYIPDAHSVQQDQITLWFLLL